MKVKEIKLGQKVKDKVTGFEGIVVHHAHFINGCHQLGIQPDKLNKDGEPIEQGNFDIQQLEVIGAGVNEEIEEKETGGPSKFIAQYGK